MISNCAVRQIIASLLLVVSSHTLAEQHLAADDFNPLPECRQNLAADAETQRLGAFYLAAPDPLLWQEPERLGALVAALEGLADDGLSPAEYHLDELSAAAAAATAAAKSRPADGCLDRLASLAYLRALEHLRYGRLEQSRWQPLWQAEPHGRAPEPLIDNAITGLDDPAHAFAQARPQSARYRNLRSAYARLRNEPLPEWEPIDRGRLLRPDMLDPRVPALARRLAASGYIDLAGNPASDQHYRPDIALGLAEFQRRHGLKVDSVLGPDTLAALNVSPASRLDQLRVNLERMRWLAALEEPDLLLVDLGAARLELYRNGRRIWESRTQVGRPDRPSPELKSRITHLTLNPTWTVPPTILREDKLPQIRADLTFLERNHLQVLDPEGRPLDPSSVDWANPRGIVLRQPAGPANPLGQVAIRFANPFSVYLHDTPSQRLFDDANRNFSSGCVRVEGALKLVDLLTTAEEQQAIQARLASGQTQRFNLSRPLPIVMAYWTAEADDAGIAYYRPDVYNRDRALISALNRLDFRTVQR